MPAQVIREESFSPAEHLQELQERSAACISIYLTLNGAQEGTTLLSIRMKAALKQAKKRLAKEVGDDAATGWPPAELTRFAQQARRGPQHGGLAIFSRKGRTLVLHSPKIWIEGVYVGTEYYIRPLLSLLTRPFAFYLLALGEQNVRLLRCTVEGAVEVMLPEGMPRNLDQAVGFDQPDHTLENRSASGTAKTGRSGIRFGTGADEEKHEIYLSQFFSQIDAALRPLMTNQQYPLMLAGVRRKLALYSTVNTYEHLLNHHVEGSPKWLSTSDLYELAKSAWEAYQQTIEEDILRALVEADARAKLVKDVLELLPAVESGRVHHLVLPEHKAGDATDDMLNHLAVAALRHGSLISVLGNQSVPGGYAAGILRFGREESKAKAS